MTLQFTKPTFVECPTCMAKPGSPTLCAECLERRELHTVLNHVRKTLEFLECFGLPNHAIRNTLKICEFCQGTPKSDCPEHGR